jgi:5-methyltetrahydropteroyltriglutamate--homocysteine methyltransferase
MHVCGDLNDVMSDLLNFKVDILDCEFAGMPQNINTLKREWESSSKKQIGIGCVNTKLKALDDKEQVLQTINDVQSIIKHENIIIDPDCGMRMLSPELGFGKLNILKEIRKEGI